MSRKSNRVISLKWELLEIGHAVDAATERYTHVQVDATRTIVEARWPQLVDGEGSL